MSADQSILMDPNEFTLTKNVRRKDFEQSESFKEFCLGIKARVDDGLQGIVQPITWYMHAGRKYVLVGHRRAAAAKKLEIMIPAIQVDAPTSESDRIWAQLSENDPEARESLSPIELANAFHEWLEDNKRLREEDPEVPKLTLEGIATKMHKSKSWATQIYALLKLPHVLQHEVDVGNMQPAVGYEVTTAFKDRPPEDIERAIPQIIEQASGDITQVKARNAVRRIATVPQEIEEALGEIPQKPEPAPQEDIDEIIEQEPTEDEDLLFVQSCIDWAKDYIRHAKQRAWDAGLEISEMLNEIVTVIDEEEGE